MKVKSKTLFVIHTLYQKRRGSKRKKFNFKIVCIKIPEPELPLIPVVLDYVVVDVLALSQTHSYCNRFDTKRQNISNRAITFCRHARSIPKTAMSKAKCKTQILLLSCQKSRQINKILGAPPKQGSADHLVLHPTPGVKENAINHDKL